MTHNTKPLSKQTQWRLFDEANSKFKHIDPSNDLSNDLDWQCKHCSNTLYLADDGFVTCVNPKCAIINTSVIDSSAEWRYYGADDNNGSDPTRCGMPVNPLLRESSFGCKVLNSGANTYEMRKIRRYTEWQSMPYKEKSQYEEFQRITAMAEHAGISRLIIDDAIRYHKTISENKTYRGLNRDGIIAASIYISSRINNHPRDVSEIAKIFNLDSTSVTKGCKNAMSIINDVEHNLIDDAKTVLCNTTPCAFIDRYCSKLNINSELTILCKFISKRIQAAGIIRENTPHSIAAGIIYYVAHICRLNISKKDIRGVSDISEVTINKCFRRLSTVEQQLIPNIILIKYRAN
jgi:transcription initiation factor TFIIB